MRQPIHVVHTTVETDGTAECQVYEGIVDDVGYDETFLWWKEGNVSTYLPIWRVVQFVVGREKSV